MTTRRGGGSLGMRGTSPLPVALSTTKLSALVDAGAKSIRDAIGVGRTAAVGVQRDEYVRQLAKDLNRDRCHCDKQIAAIVVDIAVRGNLEDALEIAHRIEEVARLAHAEANPEPQELPLVELHMAEEHAEGEAEEAETMLAHRPSLSSKEEYLRKSSAHSERRAAMDRAVRRDIILARCRGSL